MAWRAALMLNSGTASSGRGAVVAADDGEHQVAGGMPAMAAVAAEALVFRQPS